MTSHTIRNLGLRTNVALGRGFKSHFQLQQKENFCLPKVLFLFIQAAGLVYHRRAKCGVYHQPLRVCISSRASVYLPAGWWYTMLHIDDIQPLRVWWYTLSAKVIKMQAFFIFSRKIQIVHFIPLSFNLWGIVQLLIRLKELLIFNGSCDIINSPINKNLARC